MGIGRLFRAVFWAAAVFAVIGGSFYGLYRGAEFLLRWHFNPEPPAADYPKPADEKEAQLQDLDYLKQLLAMDKSFSDQARAKAEARIAGMETQAGGFSRQAFRMNVAEILAMADNGHTSQYSGEGARPNLLPIRVKLFADGLYVMQAQEAQADLAGARVEAIEGRPTAEVLRALMKYRGGTEAFRLTYAEIIVYMPDLLYGAGLAPDPARSTWTFRLADGRTETRTLEAYRPAEDEPGADGHRWLSPLPLKGLPGTWVSYLKNEDGLPLAWLDFDRTFRSAWIGGSCVYFVQLKSNEDDGDQLIAPFLDATEAEMKAKRPCAVILDMRYNGGGDYTNTYWWAGRLPENTRPDAPIYILTGPATFSAGITTTGFVKQAAPERVKIAGEPVGDRMKFWSEGNRGCLPNSHICVRYMTGLHDYHDDCTDWNSCFWLNWYFKVRVDSFEPDETVPLRFADYAAKRDAAFERALALAQEAAK